MWNLLDPKSGPFEPHPLNLLQTPHFVAKSGPFGRCTPLATGLNSAIYRAPPFDFQGGHGSWSRVKKKFAAKGFEVLFFFFYTPQMNEIFFFSLTGGWIFVFKNYHCATKFRGWVEIFFLHRLQQSLFVCVFLRLVKSFFFSLNSGWSFFSKNCAPPHIKWCAPYIHVSHIEFHLGTIHL